MKVYIRASENNHNNQLQLLINDAIYKHFKDDDIENAVIKYVRYKLNRDPSLLEGYNKSEGLTDFDMNLIYDNVFKYQDVLNIINSLSDDLKSGCAEVVNSNTQDKPLDNNMCHAYTSEMFRSKGCLCIRLSVGPMLKYRLSVHTTSVPSESNQKEYFIGGLSLYVDAWTSGLGNQSCIEVYADIPVVHSNSYDTVFPFTPNDICDSILNSLDTYLKNDCKAWSYDVVPEEEDDELYDWYYTDEADEDMQEFSEKLYDMLQEKYPDSDIEESASVQGLIGEDRWIITNPLGKHWSRSFDFKTQVAYIRDNGVDDAVNYYFSKFTRNK